MQIAKWGNSLAVRIPVDVIRALGLKEGDNIELRALEDGKLAVVSESQQRRLALTALRRFRATAPAGFKFDRENANAR